MKKEKTPETAEKMPETEISKKGRFLAWLDNYWYHYKWHTIIVAFVIFVVAVCVIQAAGTKKHDVKILYAGQNTLTAQEAKDIEEVMVALIPDDYNGDGEISLALNRYTILSESQIKATGYDRNLNVTDYQNYNTYIQTGEASMLFLEPWLYEELDKECLCKLSTVMGETVPVGAVDEYAVKLGDTAIYETFPALQKLPAETIVCLQVPLYHEQKMNKTIETLYGMEKSMFAAFLTYQPNS